MQRDKYAKIQLRPKAAPRIDVGPEEVHHKYDLNVQTSAVATATGHLELFRLTPSDPQLPAFSARWDIAANSIDIDLIGDGNASKAFKAETGGYKGHHSSLVSEEPRAYLVDIQSPIGIVFRGKVEVVIEGGVYLRDSFESLTEGMKDELRIFVACPDCGPAQVPGPPFVLTHCPKCGREFSNDANR